MNKAKWYTSMILLVLMAMTLSACGGDAQASGSNTESNVSSVSQPGDYLAGGQYSGDDAYDPAAEIPAEVYQSGGFSGDDAYDPAADLNLAPVGVSVEEVERARGGFSGDDAYDPAAGGLGR